MTVKMNHPVRVKPQRAKHGCRQQQGTKRAYRGNHVPFLSSIVTVSFWHFIKNLQGNRQPGPQSARLESREAQLCSMSQTEGEEAYLTSFMMAACV